MVEFQEDLLRFFKGRTSVGNPFHNGFSEWYNPHKMYKFIEHVHLYDLKKSKPVLSHTLLAPNGASRQPFSLRDGL
ncbi:hypothetical protein [Bartonella sp. CL266QHHD]|uniref:hypothetical protein n=1 Tax=Bartonella sp. CL266QHHD TaxID=3243519 RepID=UPI0035CEF551